MTLSALQLLLLVATPLLLGAGILRAIGISWRDDRLAFLGWCWLAGNLATGIAVFLWMWSEPHFERVGLIQSLLLAWGVGLWFVGRKRHPEGKRDPEEAVAPRGERALFAIVVSFVLLLLFQRIAAQASIPVLADDEAHFWALKAKALFLCGGFGEEFRALMAMPIHSLNLDYPPLNPLLQALVYAQAGEVTDVANRLPVQLFAPALLLIVAAGLRQVARPFVAAGFLLLLASAAPMTNLVLHAEGDLMVAVGMVASFDAWRRWRRDRSSAWLRLAVIALALMLWSKHEGMMLLVAMVAAGLCASPSRLLGEIRRFRPRPGTLWALLPLVLLATTWFLNGWLETDNNFLRNESRDESLFVLIPAQIADRTAPILAFFRDRIAFTPGHSNWIFPCFLALVIGFPLRVWRSDLRYGALAILASILGFFLVFTGLPHDVDWHLRTAAPRVAFQLLPVTLLWVGWAAGSLFPSLAPPGDGENRRGCRGERHG
jgi:hypothetical protein